MVEQLRGFLATPVTGFCAVGVRNRLMVKGLQVMPECRSDAARQLLQTVIAVIARYPQLSVRRELCWIYPNRSAAQRSCPSSASVSGTSLNHLIERRVANASSSDRAPASIGGGSCVVVTGSAASSITVVAAVDPTAVAACPGSLTAIWVTARSGAAVETEAAASSP